MAISYKARNFPTAPCEQGALLDRDDTGRELPSRTGLSIGKQAQTDVAQARNSARRVDPSEPDIGISWSSVVLIIVGAPFIEMIVLARRKCALFSYKSHSFDEAETFSQMTGVCSLKRM